MTLLSIAKNEDCKQRMLQEGLTRLAIHSLIGSSEKEREYAVKLLLEFSSDEAYCKSIASEKGALVLLSSMAGDLEHPAISNLAEEILKRLEKVDDNVQHLVAAGRFEPLLHRLIEGTDDVRIEMASMVGKMTLTNSSKEQIARQGAKILVEMLFKPEGRTPSLQALYNLSALDDNATILVDAGVLMALADILFQNQDGEQDLKELAASTIANIVLKPGHWELACVNKKGASMQSESIVHSLLGILSHSSPKGEVAVLQILHGIASSPQASEAVATHIDSGGGVTIILQFLEHPEADHRIYAFRLIRILSERLGQVLANELKASNSIPLLQAKLSDTQCSDGERSDSACILSNLPLTENEVKTVLETSLIKWVVTSLKSSERTSRPSSAMVEGLLGLLLHFVRFPDPMVLDAVREHQLLTIFRDQLCFSSQPRLKQRAALGLKYLSESGRALVSPTDFEPLPPKGFFSSMFSCGKAPKVPQTCPIHSFPCEDESQICLLKGNCIKPLLDLLNDEDTNVQITVVEALSTLVSDTTCYSRRAADELERLGVSDAVIDLFTEVRTGELQEKTIWMVERILRVESHAQRYSINQTLVRALVEAFKHGNSNTKRHAQDALTNLKQISGVSGKNSSQTRLRR
ncbi:Armadillo [Macleaya cordata]|uniref:Armadillo n=1 Tax=Macleaya cordata TaxID=56857 RepID=A0A200PLM8_MACCD|nr:Armadillo [Macleaya cordata]